jgi:hypothetical protein
MSWVDELSNPARYRRQIERVQLRHVEKPREQQLEQDGVPLKELAGDLSKLARLIARAVREGSYQFSPAKRYRAKLDKDRELCRFSLGDFLVHSVAGEVLEEAIAPGLSPRLYSFRKGRSSWEAVQDFAAFVRGHRSLRHDPTTRGLYVLRADVRRFCESVPLHAGAPLWRLLQETLGVRPESFAWRMLESIARPVLFDHPGEHMMPLVGLPFGSPLTNRVLNLYLRPIDVALDRIPGAFYARFGDDVIFAHEDFAVVARAAVEVERLVAERGLTLSAHKLKRLYFNGASRPSSEWPESTPTAAVTFLKAETRFDGTVTLPREKWRVLLTEMRQRIARAAELSRDASREARAAALCQVVNEGLDSKSPFAHPFAYFLSQLVTSRQQLAELDRHMALAIAETLTGLRGPRAFRHLSWRALCQEHGLRSVVATRNTK